jgi:hypothetical protein
MKAEVRHDSGNHGVFVQARFLPQEGRAERHELVPVTSCRFVHRKAAVRIPVKGEPRS